MQVLTVHAGTQKTHRHLRCGRILDDFDMYHWARLLFSQTWNDAVSILVYEKPSMSNASMGVSGYLTQRTPADWAKTMAKAIPCKLESLQPKQAAMRGLKEGVQTQASSTGWNPYSLVTMQRPKRKSRHWCHSMQATQPLGHKYLKGYHMIRHHTTSRVIRYDKIVTLWSAEIG